MYDDGTDVFLRGIQKIITGLSFTKIGISLIQSFSSISALLIVDDTTGIGILDNGAVVAALTGIVFSAKVAMDGALVLANGLSDVISGSRKILNIKGSSKQKLAVSPSSLPPESNNDDDNKDSKKPTSQNQMQKQVEKGQAPKEVDRVDKGHIKGQQPHVHFKDGTSLNQDGTIHDAHNGVPNPSNSAKEWLKSNGWSIGE